VKPVTTAAATYGVISVG